MKTVRRVPEDIPVLVVDEHHKHYGHLGAVIHFDGEGERIKVKCCAGRRIVVNSTQIQFWEVDQ